MYMNGEAQKVPHARKEIPCCSSERLQRELWCSRKPAAIADHLRGYLILSLYYIKRRRHTQHLYFCVCVYLYIYFFFFLPVLHLSIISTSLRCFNVARRVNKAAINLNAPRQKLLLCFALVPKKRLFLKYNPLTSDYHIFLFSKKSLK